MSNRADYSKVNRRSHVSKNWADIAHAAVQSRGLSKSANKPLSKDELRAQLAAAVAATGGRK